METQSVPANEGVGSWYDLAFPDALDNEITHQAAESTQRAYTSIVSNIAGYVADAHVTLLDMLASIDVEERVPAGLVTLALQLDRADYSATLLRELHRRTCDHCGGQHDAPEETDDGDRRV